MSVKQVCQTYFKKACDFMHSTRRDALFDSAWSILNKAQLSLTSIGRHMTTKAHVKHAIKRVDRLLGNTHLHQELPLLYKALNHQRLKGLKPLVVLIDWSGCCNTKNFLLKASLIYQGRSMTLYNEVHPAKQLHSHAVHQSFLRQLKEVLPENKEVIIVTDAGFKTPWFKEVILLGWDYVGRLRGEMNIQFAGETCWKDTRVYNKTANTTVKYLGHGCLGKRVRTPAIVHLYSYKETNKGRRGQSRYPDLNARYRACHKTGWLLVTSLEGGKKLGIFMKGIYRKRMQIEQNFRDDKSLRYGFAWRHSLTREPRRIEVLCLLAVIASFFLMLLGILGESLGWQRYFQANTVKKTRVLSYLFLGRQMIQHWEKRIKTSMDELLNLFQITYENILAELQRTIA